MPPPAVGVHMRATGIGVRTMPVLVVTVPRRMPWGCVPLAGEKVTV